MENPEVSTTPTPKVKLVFPMGLTGGPLQRQRARMNEQEYELGVPVLPHPSSVTLVKLQFPTFPIIAVCGPCNPSPIQP